MSERAVRNETQPIHGPDRIRLSDAPHSKTGLFYFTIDGDARVFVRIQSYECTETFSMNIKPVDANFEFSLSGPCMKVPSRMYVQPVNHPDRMLGDDKEDHLH